MGLAAAMELDLLPVRDGLRRLTAPDRSAAAIAAAREGRTAVEPATLVITLPPGGARPAGDGAPALQPPERPSPEQQPPEPATEEEPGQEPAERAQPPEAVAARRDPIAGRRRPERAPKARTEAVAPRPERRVAAAPAPARPRSIDRPKRAAPARRAAASTGGGRSSESAIASYNESMRMGDRSTPADLSAGDYAAVLNSGSYFQRCNVPDSMSVRIGAAVQNGRAAGVTVRTTPASGSHQNCIASAVRALSFPNHPRMDVATTVFE
jgi:outer membrane biosynthesis protein TonB